MRQVNIRKLKNNLSAELFDLPVEITKNGRIVATILEKSENSQKSAKSQEPKIISKNDKHAIAESNIPTDGRQDYYSPTYFQPYPKKGR